MSEAPRILVIVVTWNKCRYVLDLLDSIDQLDYPRGHLEVLVVDNASNDGTAAAIRQAHPLVRVIENPENLGGTGGFNTGLAWAFDQPADRYRYLWLLDNDVVVHRRALTELVAAAELRPDAGVVGSTIMQLDFPWRVNEIGAHLERTTGTLVLLRHGEEVSAWRGRAVSALLAEEVGLAEHLHDCRVPVDVEYVAAASLLVRSEVARQAGLWRDFFIHFDDVEWCLRIGALGWRVLAVPASLIWHLSAAAKIPTWVLYYDNRNVLYTLEAAGTGSARIRGVMRYVLKKAAYYALIGKDELAGLHVDAVDDFRAGRTGKRDIVLGLRYRGTTQVQALLQEPSIRRVLIPWTANLVATRLQEPLVRALKARPDLRIDCLLRPDDARRYQLPGARHVPVSRWRLLRWVQYLRWLRRYDLVLQSDYQPLLGLSWLGREILFINDEGIARLRAPHLAALLRLAVAIARRYLAAHSWRGNRPPAAR